MNISHKFWSWCRKQIFETTSGMRQENFKFKLKTGIKNNQVPMWIQNIPETIWVLLYTFSFPNLLLSCLSRSQIDTFNCSFCAFRTSFHSITHKMLCIRLKSFIFYFLSSSLLLNQRFTRYCSFLKIYCFLTLNIK